VRARAYTYLAIVRDRDGDQPRLTWRVHGVLEPGRMLRRVFRFARTGVLTIEVRADDGHGRSATAALLVVVR
jgi:hypothetical protein